MAMTDADFERLLLERLCETHATDLISVPGIYEILAEYWNNDIIEDWESEQETLADLEGNTDGDD